MIDISSYRILYRMQNIYKNTVKTCSILIPQHCLICRKKSYDFFCQICLDDLPFFNILQHCEQCLHPLNHSRSKICGPCLLNPQPIIKTLAVFHYQQPIISLINQLKFFDQIHYSYIFAVLLSKQPMIRQSSAKAIMAMPLHNKRLQQRGFNQALCIAKHLAKILRLPLVHYASRIKNTPSQRGLTAIQRKENIKKAFQEKVPSIHHNHIALVDDVITTGSSMNELASCINRTQPIITEAWCIAKVN